MQRQLDDLKLDELAQFIEKDKQNQAKFRLALVAILLLPFCAPFLLSPLGYETASNISSEWQLFIIAVTAYFIAVGLLIVIRGWYSRRTFVRARRELGRFLPADAVVDVVRTRSTLNIELLIVALGCVVLLMLGSTSSLVRTFSEDGFRNILRQNIFTLLMFYIPLLMWAMVVVFSVMILVWNIVRLVATGSLRRLTDGIDPSSVTVILVSITAFTVTTSGIIGRLESTILLNLIVVLVVWLIIVGLLQERISARLGRYAVERNADADQALITKRYNELPSFANTGLLNEKLIEYDIITNMPNLNQAEQRWLEARVTFQSTDTYHISHVLNGSGMNMMYQERYDEAATFFSAAIRAMPMKVAAYRNLVECCALADADPERARTLLEFARHHSNDYEKHMFADVYTMAHNGDTDGARHMLDVIAAGVGMADADPDFAVKIPYLKLAWDSLDQKYRTRMESYMAHDSIRAEFYLARGHIEQRAGNHDTARDYYIRGHERDAHGSTGHYCHVQAEMLKVQPATDVQPL